MGRSLSALRVVSSKLQKRSSCRQFSAAEQTCLKNRICSNLYTDNLAAVLSLTCSFKFCYVEPCYGFDSSVASMKCAVMDCLASIVLCDM